MKHSVPTHSKAYRSLSFMVSLRFARFVQFLPIPCCHPQYLFQSFISTCIHQHIPLVRYIHRCAILYQDTQSHAPSDLHWLYSISYSSPYHIPFSLSMCRVGVIDPLFLFVPSPWSLSLTGASVSVDFTLAISHSCRVRINTSITIPTINLSISVNIA